LQTLRSTTTTCTVDAETDTYDRIVPGPSQKLGYRFAVLLHLTQGSAVVIIC